MNLKSYFNSQYLFQINSAFISPGEKLFFLLGVILLLVAVVLKISAKLAPTPVDSGYRKKFYVLLLTIGLLEIFWYLLRYENVEFFGSRFTAFLFLFIGLVWLLRVLLSMLKNYRPAKVAWEKEQVRMKYLPK